MKLSNRQKQCIDGMKRRIDNARSFETAEEYFNATNNNNCLWNTAEKVKAQDMKAWENEEKWWKRYCEGICLVQEKTETVDKLESLGLIKIIERAKYKGGCELVKLLNY